MFKYVITGDKIFVLFILRIQNIVILSVNLLVIASAHIIK